MKQFSIPGKGSKVYRFDKETRKSKERSTKRSESSGPNASYWNTEHESYLQKIEDKAMPLIKRLSTTKELSFGRYSWMPSTLTSADKDDLILFISMLDITGDMVRRYRSKEYNSRARLANEYRSFGLSTSSSDIEELFHSVPELSKGRIENRATYFSSLALQTIRVPSGLVVLPDIPVCGQFVIEMPPPWDHFILPMSPNSILLGCHPDVISYFTLQYLGRGLRETLAGEPHSRYVYSSVKLPQNFQAKSIWPGAENWGEYDKSLWNPQMMITSEGTMHKQNDNTAE